MAGRLVYVLKPHVNAVTGVHCQAPMLYRSRGVRDRVDV